LRPQKPLANRKGVDMVYFIDLFSPETYEAFAHSSRDISGFRLRHKNTAERISPGDLLLCYLTRLSRCFSLLEGSPSADGLP
jgi:hypothetical protein